MKAIVMLLLLTSCVAVQTETLAVQDKVVRENSPATLLMEGLTEGEQYTVNWTGNAIGRSFTASSSSHELIVNIKIFSGTTSVMIYLYNTTALVSSISVAYLPASGDDWGDLLLTYGPVAGFAGVGFLLLTLPLAWIRRGRNG